jgi:hypothetical protein
MRRATLALLLSALAGAAVAGALATPSARMRPVETPAVSPTGLLYAISWHGREATLYRVNPATLGRLSRKVFLGRFWSGRGFSPDGSRLALTREAEDGPPALRILDVRTRRLARAVRLGPGGAWLSAWLRRDRILVVRGEGLLVVDASGPRVLRQVSFPGQLLQVERAGDVLVVLLARPNDVGPATLAVVDAEGELRSVVIERVPAGFRVDEQSGAGIRSGASPGLAVDPEDRRAFVAGGGTPVAEVSLDDLRVAYHEPVRPVSLFGRLHDWLEPKAEAKGLNGPQRTAVWLGTGLLVVTGADEKAWVDAQGHWHTQFDPAGLSLIDTASWQTRTIDPQASLAVPVAGALVTVRPGALVAYELDGAVRWRLVEAAAPPLGIFWTNGPYLYVPREDDRIAVVDARSGAIVGRHAGGISLLSPSGRAW